MSPTVLLSIFCVLILLVSLAGGLIPLLVRLTHRRMQLAVSLVAGVMLGVGLLHLLPHALLEAPDAMDAIFTWVLVGFLAMFFIERFFCFHHHDVPETDHGEGSDDVHGGHEGPCCEHVDAGTHRLTWGGAAVGLTLHTIIAGIALAASVEVESHGEQVTPIAGLGTFLVIFFHKPFDALTISTLMAFGGWSTLARHLVNGLFALMIPVGVVLFHLGLGQVHSESNLVAYALAFSAGTFLCIAMSDLLPELQFHAHDRVGLSVLLLAGLLFAWGIGLIESTGHSHGEQGHSHGTEAREQGGEHDGHAHDAGEHDAGEHDAGEHDAHAH